jgi:hemerythrin
MTSLAWTTALELGEQVMDDTHREFVDLVNAMLLADDAQFGDRLQAFREHAERHFGEEDRQMQAGYPSSECHVEEHRAVIASVLQVQMRVKDGDIATGRRLAAELARWFSMHTEEMDRGLAMWMQKRRLGGVRVTISRRVPAV